MKISPTRFSLALSSHNRSAQMMALFKSATAITALVLRAGIRLMPYFTVAMTRLAYVHATNLVAESLHHSLLLP